jgi:uncharacterized protein (DUF885 family)
VPIQNNQKDSSLNAALRVVDDAWRELQCGPYVQSRMGTTPSRLPDVSLAEAERRSSVGRSLLKRLGELDSTAWPHDLSLTLRLVRFRAQTWAREADWYWTVFDPSGVGFFGLFAPTAYCGGFLLHLVKGQLSAFPFAEQGDLDRYLALVTDYGRLIDQFTERTAGQARRGVRMPKVQVQQARTLLAAFKTGAHTAAGVASERLSHVVSASFAIELANRISTCVEPAFDRAVAALSGAYLEQAPETVGMSQYPGGAEIYRELVKLHTTLDLTPDQVHARGLKRMDEIERSMGAIQAELGFAHDSVAFLKHLNSDPRWRASTVDGVAEVFQRYIDRLKPHINEAFARLPRASYGVTPLPEALEGSMTFGYYDSPTGDRNSGLYHFNGANLTKQALFNVAALTYHELVPGHHLHIATQQENDALHPFRAHSFVNAYNEGWAEYAATFAGEIGMYREPQELYGRLVMDAFLTSRLVVDTGMNALGWSLERAREYMRKHSRMAEAEVLTESVRYSCDMPGQALAYKLGDTQILMMRERMREALGTRFALKDFHSAVLAPGALPIPDLEWHVEGEIKRLLATSKSP